MLAVLSLFLFVNYLDRYALAILLEPIKVELQLSDTQVGLLTGAAFALLYSTLALPVARIAEHRNRTTVLSAAILIWSVATALCGLAGSFMALFAARMLVGAGESGAVSPAQSMIGDAFSLERRGTALAIFSIGGALGTSLAPMIGGYLEAHFGWRGALLFLGSLGVPVALLLLLVVRDPPRGFADRLVARTPPPPVGLAMRRLFSRPAFALLIPGMVAIGLAEYSFFLWLPSYLSRTFGQPAAAIGTSLTLYQGIPLLIGTLLGGVVADRLVLRDRRWLAWLPAAACVFAALTIRADDRRHLHQPFARRRAGLARVAVDGAGRLSGPLLRNDSGAGGAALARHRRRDADLRGESAGVGPRPADDRHAERPVAFDLRRTIPALCFPGGSANLWPGRHLSPPRLALHPEGYGTRRPRLIPAGVGPACPIAARDARYED